MDRDGHRTTLLIFFILPSAVLLKGVVLPNDPNIFIGRNLTLSCNLSKYDPVYDSKYLYFTRGNDVQIPDIYTTIKSTRSLELHYPIQGPEDEGMYTCMLNKTKPDSIGYQYVRVDYKIEPVRNIDCRVYNWDNMTCTWDLIDYVHPNNLKITLIWTINQLNYPQYNCIHQTATSCSWPTGNETFVIDVDYIMSVEILRKGENLSQADTVKFPSIMVNTSDIVQPAPVFDLQHDPSRLNSTCVTLSWKQSKPLRKHHCKVEYRRSTELEWQSSEVSKVDEATLCGLHAYTRYNFSVSCLPIVGHKAKLVGFWSTRVYVAVTTAEDSPATGPELYPGSYVELPCTVGSSTCKRLLIYWKPLKAADARGKIFFYRIKYGHAGSSSVKAQTSVMDTQAELSVDTGHPYNIEIEAVNKHMGASPTSSLYIPSDDNRPRVPEHVVEVQNTSSGATIRMTWAASLLSNRQSQWRNITSFTVFWCNGILSDKKCIKPIRSAEVSASKREIEIEVEENFERYMFGVAVNMGLSSGKTISSGFQWNKCIYIKETVPGSPIQNVRLPSFQPNSGLNIEWDKLTCLDTKAYILKYVIYICPSEDRVNCTGATTTIDVGNTVDFYTVDGLVKDEWYRVWVGAESAVGVGPVSNVVFGHVIDDNWTPGQLALIVISVLLGMLIFLCAIIISSRRIIVIVKKRYLETVHIELPHSLPPLPPIPMPASQISPDSDDGIYAKILDEPPSPGSSVESTTGAEAPLLHHKWNLSKLKSHIYGRKKEQNSRQSKSDSGGGSMSHSADTLLMRLHKKRKSKKSNKSESDSGIIVNGHGQVFNYVSSDQSQNNHSTENSYDTNTYNFSQDGGKGEFTPSNPYSSVNMQLSKPEPIICTLTNGYTESESLVSNLSNTNPQVGGKGSTMSLPLCKTSPVTNRDLDLEYRTKSAENDLDIDHQRKLSCMKEGRELDSSDIYSEGGTMNSTGDTDPDSSEGYTNSMEHDGSPIDQSSSEGSRSEDSAFSRSGSSTMSSTGMCPSITYMKERNEFEKSNKSSPPSQVSHNPCTCGCHSNKLVELGSPVANGYVSQDMMVNHREDQCKCLQCDESQSLLKLATSPFSNGISGQPSNGISRNHCNGIAGYLSNGIAGQVSNGIAGQVSNGIAGQLSNGIAGHFSNGIAGQLSNGIAGQLSNGIAGHFSNGIAGQVSNGIAGKVSNGIVGYPSNGITKKYSVGKGEEALKLSLLQQDHLTDGCRSPSQVYNLPAHIFGSMSSVPVDPSRTTEL